MRRALLVAAVALPAAGLAALTVNTAGLLIEVNTYDATKARSYLNRDACGLDGGTGKASLEWLISPVSGSFAPGGTYQIIASDTVPLTTGEVGFCPPDAPTGNPIVHAQQVQDGSVNATDAKQDLQVPGADIAAKAGKACTSDHENQSVWVCAHWIDGGAKRGHASGQFLIQIAQPVKPIIQRVGTGEGRLAVYFDTEADSNADHWIAQATSPTGAVFYSTSTKTSPALISGLENFTDYTVVLVAYSVGGNRNVADSDPFVARPQPSADFWDAYKKSGGVENGGCASGPAGTLALLGAAALLAARRRVR